YRDLKEIIAAIQQGAAQLVEIEQNPPSDAPSVPPSSNVQPTTSVTPAEAQSSADVNGTTDENGAIETQTLNSPENVTDSDSDNAGEPTTTTLLDQVDDLPVSVNNPPSGVTRPAISVQMPLL